MPNYLSKIVLNGTEMIIKDSTITPELTPNRKVLMIGDEEFNRGIFKSNLQTVADITWSQDAGMGFTNVGAGAGYNFKGILEYTVNSRPDVAEKITDIVVLGGAHEVNDEAAINTALSEFATYAFDQEHFPILSRVYLGFIPNTHLTGTDYDNLMIAYEAYKNKSAQYKIQYIQNIELVGRNNAYVQDPNDSFPVGLNAAGMNWLSYYLKEWFLGTPIPDTYEPIATTLGGDDYATADHPKMYTQIIKGMLYVYLTIQQDFSLKAEHRTGTWNSAHPMVIGSVTDSGYCFGHATNRMSGYTSVQTIYRMDPVAYYATANPFRIKDGDVIINPGVYVNGQALTGTIDRIFIEKFTQIGDAMYS